MKNQILTWLEKNRPQDKGARARVIHIWQKEEAKKKTQMVRISPTVMRRRKI